MNADTDVLPSTTRPKFTATDFIREAWHKTKGAKGTIWLATLINIGINLFLELMDYLSNHNFIVSIIYFIVSNLLTMGVVLIGTRRALDLPINTRMLFETFKLRYGLRILVTIILVSVILFVPLIFIVFFHIYAADIGEILATVLSVLMSLVFIYLAIRMALSFRIVLMQDVSPWQAIKLSWQATRHHFWLLLWFGFLTGLIIIVSMLPLLIGLIWTVPFYIIAWGVVYRHLVVEKQAIITPAPTPPTEI